MLKKIEGFINGLGDWNHAFIVAVLFYPVSMIIQLIGFSEKQSYVLTMILLIFGYYMKEHGSSRHSNNLTEIQSLNPANWSDHDRKQTVYLSIVAVIMTVLFTTVIPVISNI